MIINRNGNNLLGIILSDHKIIQLCFDLVRRRNVFDIQYRFIFRFLLFLLQLLFIRNPTVSLQIRQIDKADVWELLGQVGKI